MMPLLQLHDLEDAGRLGPITALVDKAQMLHLVGPNGAGKSTLLARLAGLTQGKGSVQLNGRPLEQWHAPQLARHRAYLSQQQTPPFAMPVWHYLALHQHHHPNDNVVEEITHKLGLADKLGRTVNHLSGGEWQRVRLAAVIAQIHPEANADGQLLLLDEPMNSLDVAQQAALDGMLSELVAAGITVVMSSHDLNHSLRRAHQVWLLRQGKLIASGPRDEVLTPQNLATAYGMPFRRLDLAGHRMLIPEV
ncbi:vitamin B12 ABC transporter ATP-binding protein BtuD [Phytobacter diazotrophicus]|uniref:vitamin B12 ABC transporter ATP-binding protein BtuD n=2 Tax=Enterobacteriaceae TaxID=543 RepID=UPI0014512D87|nr:vitamin B12 ABC transporter ATP-binding protein BtuD [Phytobacter diazotrophicus]MBY6259159.1 vitamin B12 ABC transporter ATP-binding protein BtuD [Phytobacter diazotrophicus]QJF19837.1 vitamin B12 ABC transporter ATP-binding protein BtuD [Phytobacter diazotrophicus]